MDEQQYVNSESSCHKNLFAKYYYKYLYLYQSWLFSMEEDMSLICTQLLFPKAELCILWISCLQVAYCLSFASWGNSKGSGSSSCFSNVEDATFEVFSLLHALAQITFLIQELLQWNGGSLFCSFTTEIQNGSQSGCFVQVICQAAQSPEKRMSPLPRVINSS